MRYFSLSGSLECPLDLVEATHMHSSLNGCSECPLALVEASRMQCFSLSGCVGPFVLVEAVQESYHTPFHHHLQLFL